MASEFTRNVVSGNRANLLFVESSLQMIKDNQEASRSSMSAMGSDRINCFNLQNAILGLQNGHFMALERVSGPDQPQKDALWAVFRSSST